MSAAAAFIGFMYPATFHVRASLAASNVTKLDDWEVGRKVTANELGSNNPQGTEWSPVPPSATNLAGTADAAVTVYRHILAVEDTIAQCIDMDSFNKTSYEFTVEKYQSQVSDLVTMIGVLVGQEARRSNVAKDALFETINRLIGVVAQQQQQIANADPQSFTKACLNLLTAIANRTTPFEPLEDKFPEEIRVIRGWWESNIHH